VRCAHGASTQDRQVGVRAALQMQPSRYRHLTALGLAHALLAGSQQRHSLQARAQQALGHAPLWLPVLLEQVFPVSGATWARMTPGELAARIERAPIFPDAFLISEPPMLRRWILRPSSMVPAPLGLNEAVLPRLDDSAALARWLGISAETLDWFTYCSPRRRCAPLHAQHYAFSLQPKRHGGGGRLIEAPRQRLKALQGRVLTDLLNAVPVHEACHGFVVGRSVLTHAQAHAGQAVLLTFDLKNFFNSVTAAQVAAVFRALGYPPGVAWQLASLCTVSTPEPVIERMRDDGWLDWHQAHCLRHPHLAQGAPSSPMLANLCAFGLDLRLDGLAQVLGARYSRYADDLVISGPAMLAAAAPRIAAWVGCIAVEEGYAINHRKSRLATQAQAQQVCGVVVNQHLNLKRHDFDRLRAVLHQCALRGPASQNREGHADFRAHLQGKLDWATQLNPVKARRLHALWDRIDWSAA
jgi:RNA-directed DNA polymerase